MVNSLLNWKLVTVMLISLILLVVCYLTLDLDKSKYVKYFPGREKEKEKESDNSYELFENSKKVKTDIQKEEDLKKIKIPDNYIVYYFPVKCPDYKQEFFLVSNEEGLEKYYLPEENHLILIKKEHKWTKDPNFVYWKYPIE